jgi:hypothetical protein
MNIIESIINYIKKPEIETEGTAPDGICPVCWGYQQYNGKIRDLFKDRQADINNHKDHDMIIQEFVKTNIDGIKLLDAEVKSCPECNIDCKEEEE